MTLVIALLLVTICAGLAWCDRCDHYEREQVKRTGGKR